MKKAPINAKKNARIKNALMINKGVFY